jgi:hypothetical protein
LAMINSGWIALSPVRLRASMSVGSATPSPSPREFPGLDRVNEGGGTNGFRHAPILSCGGPTAYALQALRRVCPSSGPFPRAEAKGPPCFSDAGVHRDGTRADS